MNQKFATVEKVCLSLCLPLGIIDIARGDWWPSLACLALCAAIALHKSPYRPAAIQIAGFLVAYAAYRLAAVFLSLASLQPDFGVLADRFALLVIVGLMAVLRLITKQPAIGYIDWPDWSARIDFAWSKGRLKPIGFKRFYLVSLFVTVAVFATLTFTIQSPSAVKLPALAFSFAIINATLEEIIWRGQLMAGLSRTMGLPLAVAVSSLGFGFQHLALGFNLPVSLAMAVGGAFFALFTIKSKSLIPAIIFHAVTNLGMVACGLILR